MKVSCIIKLRSSLTLDRDLRSYDMPQTEAYLKIKIYNRKTFIVQATGAGVIKLFRGVIYCHSVAIMSFRVVKNVTVVITIEWQNINIIKSFITVAHGGKIEYCGNLPSYFHHRKFY